LIQAIEEEQKLFFGSPDGYRLRLAASRSNPAALYNCFHIRHIPGQGEDYHLILVDANDLMKFSIDRKSGIIVLEDRERMPQRWQARGWGRSGQMILKLARQKKRALARDGAGRSRA
jgi:hypothetical protein